MLKTLLAVLLFVASSGSALAADVKVEITEWEVPWAKSRPRDPYIDANNYIWFVGQVGNYLARLDPKTRDFRRFELDPETGPHNVIVGKDGSVWYAGNRAAHIGLLDAKTGKITKYPMPDPAARDPHTLTFDSRGDIWFSVQGGNFVGKLTIATGNVQLIRMPTPQARPYGIVVDSTDRPWICEFGTNKIAAVDPQTMQLTEHILANDGARPRRIAVTSDNAVWYVDYARGFLGRLDPKTGKNEEWQAPAAAESKPYAMTVDDRDRLWFVETGIQPNRLVGFDPKTKEFISINAIKSGGGAVRHMVFHKPSREIWFGSDANTIGRARIP